MQLLRVLLPLAILLSVSIFFSLPELPETHTHIPKFIDSKKCSDAMWQYFRSHRGEFHGEVGHEAMKDKLIALKVQLKETASMPRGKWLMVDVGANLGEYVTFYRSLIEHIPSTLHLIEPNPMNVQYLIKQFGHIPDIKIHNLGVYNESKMATFDAAKQILKEGNQFAHVISEPVKNGSIVSTTWNTFENKLLTLDSLFKEELENQDNEFVFLKTDTVGHDVLVMLGAPLLLSRVRLYIFDCNKLQLVQQGGPGSSHMQAAEFLSNLGFDVFKLSARQMILFSGEFYSEIVDDPKFMHWHNCFAMRRKDPLWATIFQASNTLDECQFT